MVVGTVANGNCKRFLKVTCDKLRPCCSHCVLAGRKCHYAVVVVDVHPPQRRLPLKAACEKELTNVQVSRSDSFDLESEASAHFDVPVGLGNWTDLQMQISNVFIEECRPGHNRMEGCFTSLLPETDISPKPVSLITAALALLHASSKQSNNDPRLLHEAGKVYGNAMNCLRQHLIRGSQHNDFIRSNAHPVLLSMMLLGLYDEPEETPPHLRLAERSWQNHLYASARFINGVGARGFDLSKPADAAAILSSVVASYKTCLSFRRKMIFEHQILRSLVSRIASKLPFSVALFRWFDIIWPLPGLLEQADALLNVPPCEESTCRLAGIMQQLVTIRPKIHSFMQAVINPLITLESPDDLDLKIEEHCFLASSTLFLPQHRFPSLIIAVISILAWVGCLTADCTALRIINQRLPLRENCIRVAQEVERGAFDTAFKLCQSVQFLSERDCLTYVHTVKTVVALAGAFFAEAGAVEEADWCEACGIASELRLHRLEPIRPRTMCRAPNVTPALVAGVRYRSPATSKLEDLIT